MTKILLIIIVLMLNPSPPHEVVDPVILVSGSPSLAQCELTRREVVAQWSTPEGGMFVWSWCVEARIP